MEGRYVLPRTALVAGLIVSLGACTTPKAKVDKRLDEAAARWKAEQSVNQGIDKEIVPPSPVARRLPGGSQALRNGESVWMQPGKSKVMTVPYNVTRVSIGNPDLAGVVVLGPRSVLINAKELPHDAQQQGGGGMTSQAGLLSSRTFTPPPQIGETTVILWDNANHTDSHTVYVADFSTDQVLLAVTIADLNRTRAEARGVDFQKLSGSVKAGYFLGGGSVPGSLLFTPSANPGSTLAPPFPLVTGPERPTFAFQSEAGDITALVTMLQTEGLATVLAQPKILALNGQYAVFQVGGEIPIRIVTSFSAEVEFKAFGTLVNFLPRVSDDGDIILTVTPEVSQPDFNNTVEGVPTFRVRRASTTAKLREGESLVLGGLTQRQRIENERGIPYLKDIPFAGMLFRDTQFTDETTELMVIATPYLVKPVAPETDFALPTDRGPLTRDEVKTKPSKAEVTRPRLPTPATRPSTPQPR